MTKRLKIPAPPQHQKTVDGRFRLIREIGQGATGIVYEGIQLSVDRRVAVKVLNPGYNVREDYQERFSREAKAIARLNHTHCITLYDFGYSEEFESLYMVMEYVDGRELYQVTKKQRLELPTALNIAIQIADAVAHAHSHGILHRDLKPENVLIMRDGTAKVLDFGMARIVDELSNEGNDSEKRRLTQQGAVYGTPAYMSPEQCQGNIDVSPQTDIYSLGVMLFELVEGRLPYQAKKVLDILVQHVRDPVPPVETDVPDRLRQLITSMLAKRPVERPSSAKIVAETLRAIRLEVPVEGEERSTVDVSQEIQKSLLFGDDAPHDTGEGMPRTTMQGVGEVLLTQKKEPLSGELPLPSAPNTDEFEEPEHQRRLVETMQPAMLTESARQKIRAATSHDSSLIDEIDLSAESRDSLRFGSERFNYEPVEPVKRSPAGLVVGLIVFAAICAAAIHFAQMERAQRSAAGDVSTTPSAASIEEEVAASGADAPAPDVADNGAASSSPLTNDAITSATIEVAEAVDFAAIEAPSSVVPPVVTPEPARKVSRRPVPRPAKAKTLQVAAPRKAPPKVAPEPPREDPPPREEAQPSKKEKKGASSEEEEKLPTIRFTY